MLNFSTVIIVHVSKNFVIYFFSIVSWLCSHILNVLRNHFFQKKSQLFMFELYFSRFPSS